MSHDPYANNFPAPPLDVELPELEPGAALAPTAWAADANRSPAVRWGALPEGTRSLIVTAFDPDAPIPGGFWHWLVADVPADAGGLPAGAGESDATLPSGARHLQGSMGFARYAGVNPPAGTGTHRLFVGVTALDVPTLAVAADAGAAQLQIAAIRHTLARGVAIATSRAPAAPAAA